MHRRATCCETDTKTRKVLELEDARTRAQPQLKSACAQVGAFWRAKSHVLARLPLRCRARPQMRIHARARVRTHSFVRFWTDGAGERARGSLETRTSLNIAKCFSSSSFEKCG
eukprot:5564693-Pleurochrysis_carterae.AAC.1